MAWHVEGVKEVGFQSSFEGVQGHRCQNRGWRQVYCSGYSWCRDYKGV